MHADQTSSFKPHGSSGDAHVFRGRVELPKHVWRHPGNGPNSAKKRVLLQMDTP